ncbi:NUDIX hydrolase [Haladaptatus sp. DFWS20]|uniref:NUDIX hydrolase n=1 Tax=Haladaptatus sp. DFWS20 TaxID=3403467 RepID=UPI003EBA3639
MNNLTAIRRWEGVREGTRTFSVPAENFATIKETIESGRDKWVGVAVVDDDGRVLLVENGWSDGWIVPGGTVEMNETLADAAVREVTEETGVSVELDRPFLVEYQTFTHDNTEISGYFVLFGATTSETEIGADLGIEGETIHDARWFTDLPEITHHEAVESYRE